MSASISCVYQNFILIIMLLSDRKLSVPFNLITWKYFLVTQVMENSHELGKCWPAFKGNIKVVVSRQQCPCNTREITGRHWLCRMRCMAVLHAVPSLILQQKLVFGRDPRVGKGNCEEMSVAEYLVRQWRHMHKSCKCKSIIKDKHTEEGEIVNERTDTCGSEEDGAGIMNILFMLITSLVD